MQPATQRQAPVTKISTAIMTRYDDVDYWDNRYTNDKEPFEWYLSYSGIRSFFTPKYLSPLNSKVSTDGPSEAASPAAEKQAFPHSNRVLIIGCGNSKLGEDMLQDGFKQITNVDFSSVVIRQMQSHYNDQWHQEMHIRLREERKIKDDNSPKPKASTRTRLSKPSPVKQPQEKLPIQNKITFACHDITLRLEFADSSFDLIVCKGTLDAILCNQNAFAKVESMMNECHRLLDSAHGVMVVVSHSMPDDRLNCFDTALWRDIKTYTVPKPMVPGLMEVGA